LALAACGKDPGNPVEVVESFMTAIDGFDIAAAKDLVCEAQQDRLQNSLEPFYGVTELTEAFNLSFKDLFIEERSNDGETAIVHVNGSAELSFLGQDDVQEVNEDHVVVKENGRWVVCDP
jgi:hypothetical protein